MGFGEGLEPFKPPEGLTTLSPGSELSNLLSPVRFTIELQDSLSVPGDCPIPAVQVQVRHVGQKMAKLETGVQYGDWKGRVAADGADRGDIHDLFRKTSPDAGMLVAWSLYVTEGAAYAQGPIR